MDGRRNLEQLYGSVEKSTPSKFKDLFSFFCVSYFPHVRIVKKKNVGWSLRTSHTLSTYFQIHFFGHSCPPVPSGPVNNIWHTSRWNKPGTKAKTRLTYTSHAGNPSASNKVIDQHVRLDSSWVGPWLPIFCTTRKGSWYRWWKKSCPSWYGESPIIYRVLCMSGSAGISSINSKMDNDGYGIW